ncbi:MAG: hypothetical protein KAH97_08260 [Anaerolineales bacterium]|nr:hypothetical protein [Anaerolineales bacterium]
MADQRKRRVILLATQLLLGEALANILNKQDDVELIGPLVPDPQNLAGLSEQNPDIFLFINEGNDADQAVATQILSLFPDYPFLQVSTEQSIVRVYTSESHRTSSVDLIETIRALPMKKFG